MKQILLKPVNSCTKVFNFLEKNKLIKTLKPTKKAVTTKTKTGTVDILYTSRKNFGSHRLMCIGKRNTKVQLCYHKDNEDLFFLNPENIDYKPLYLIFAVDKVDVFLKKLKNDELKNSDFITVKIMYNNINFSFFTVLKNTVHCEITMENDKKQHPVFFVSESSNLKNNKIAHKNLKFVVSGEL